MAKKKTENKQMRNLIILGLLILIALPILLWIANNYTMSPDSLALEVSKKVVCPENMRPTLICPAGVRLNNPEASPWLKLWKSRWNDCSWQCTPWPSIKPFPSSNLSPSFLPLPRPSFCPEKVICPVNCPMIEANNGSWNGCPICRCGPPMM